MERSCEVKEEAVHKNCAFCWAATGQIRAILRISYVRLRKMLKEKRYADMPLTTQENNGAISRFLRVAFDQNQFQLKLSKNCPHFRLRNMLRDKLKCRNDQLQVILQELCDIIARRNYQLEIIASQIKNVETSVAQIDQIQELSLGEVKLSESQAIFREEQRVEAREEQRVEAREEPEKKEQQPQVKVEEGTEGTKKLAQGSPSTVIPVVSTTFGQMPFSYNFLFYGNYYH